MHIVSFQAGTAQVDTIEEDKQKRTLHSPLLLRRQRLLLLLAPSVSA